MTNEYDLIADDYEKLFNAEQYKAEDKELENLLPFPDGADILDIGCGAGTLYKLLNDRSFSGNFRYYGIDPSGKMLEKFKVQRPNVITEQTTFEDYKAIGKFDTVISIYGGASYIDPSRIGKIKDLLIKGGRFFIMFYKDDYVPVTHQMAKGKVELKNNKFADYVPFFRAISENVIFKEWHNYMIVEGTV